MRLSKLPYMSKLYEILSIAKLSISISFVPTKFLIRSFELA